MRGYTLPAGKVQISFSGGRTSAYMLHQILAVNGDLNPEKVQVVFANTGFEMPETLDFVQECSQRWGVTIVWVEDAPRVAGEPIFDIVNHNSASRNGEPFKRLVARKKAVPSQDKRFCTTDLKFMPARRYLTSIGWKAWTNALGMRSDERHRCNPSTDKRITRWFPLAEDVDKRIVSNFWAGQDFDLKTEKGYGNCHGCFLKSEAQLALLCRKNPEIHAEWESLEEKAGARFRYSYSRKQLRKMVESQGDWIFDLEDALCQADHGECTS